MDHTQTPDTSKIEEIRAQRRLENNERRKKKTHDLLTVKRKWKNEENPAQVTSEHVAELTRELKKHKKIEILRYLSDAFSRGDEFIDGFLSVDGALYALIGCLLGKDVNLKLSSVVCLINLGTGSHKSTSCCIKASAAYLLAFLGNGSHELQELCVWALGNFAADCENCSEILRKQGFVPAVVKLLKSPNDKVQFSAYFALVCYTFTRRNKIDEELLNHETLSLISHPLISTNSPAKMAESASIIFHLTCSGQNDVELVKAGVLDVVVFQLLNSLQKQPDVISVITPLTRSLANLCSGDTRIIQNLVLKPELGLILYLLMQSRYNHVVKESLWLLGNIVGCSEGVVVLQDVKIVKKVVDLCESIGSISLQCLLCLCNMSAVCKEICSVLVGQMGIFDKLNALLLRRDAETVKGCLTLMGILIGNVEKDQLLSTSQQCLSQLSLLQTTSDPQIQKLCHFITQKLL